MQTVLNTGATAWYSHQIIRNPIATHGNKVQKQTLFLLQIYSPSWRFCKRNVQARQTNKKWNKPGSTKNKLGCTVDQLLCVVSYSEKFYNTQFSSMPSHANWSWESEKQQVINMQILTIYLITVCPYTLNIHMQIPLSTFNWMTGTVSVS